MYQFEIGKNEAGQRFDKYLHKLMPKAPTSFFYKMLRKKNIVLNGKKAEGKEKLAEGDVVKLFLAEETFQSFCELQEKNEADFVQYEKAYKSLKGIRVIYESEHMLILNKPTGVLSQKAKEDDLSVNEWLIGYLLAKRKVSEKSLGTYKPSVCNRLDRNTSGLIICACSLPGSQEIGRLIKEREIRKFYRLFAKGKVEKEALIEGYLIKNNLTNKVKIVSREEMHKTDRVGQGDSASIITDKDKELSYIKTKYIPLKHLQDKTYLEIELFTGKTHQIRAHMASVGHPLLGDYKYGIAAWNDNYKKKYGIASQLLHAYRLVFPQNAVLSPDGPMTFVVEEPEVFMTLLERG